MEKREDLITRVIQMAERAMTPSEISKRIFRYTIFHPGKGIFMTPYDVWETVQNHPESFHVSEGRIDIK